MSGDDVDVLTRAKRGDRSAFSTLVRKYQKRVYATALQILGNHHDADDVSQETFVRAFRFLPKFDERADFFTWLYRITVNTSLNHIRSRKRVRKIAARGAEKVEAEGGRPESPGSQRADPRESAALQERYRRMLDQVFELSPSLRTTLVLATVQGKAYKEIAATLGIPEGTVAWRVSEARKQLRERVEHAEYREALDRMAAARKALRAGDDQDADVDDADVEDAGVDAAGVDADDDGSDDERDDEPVEEASDA